VTLLVVDASALVAVLTDGNGTGAAVAAALAGCALAAPELLPFETANVLRRLEQGGQLSSETAALAHGDLLDLPVQLWPYAALAAAAWRLRGSLTLYDAPYVALAVQLDVPLVTLDLRLVRAASACQVVVPGSTELAP
jgi:predicted nucleic acid-binding protein